MKILILIILYLAYVAIKAIIESVYSGGHVLLEGIKKTSTIIENNSIDPTKAYNIKLDSKSKIELHKSISQGLSKDDLYDVLYINMVGQISNALTSVLNINEQKQLSTCNQIISQIKYQNIFSDFLPAYNMGVLNQLVMFSMYRGFLSTEYMQPHKHMELLDNIFEMIHGKYSKHESNIVGEVGVSSNPEHPVSLIFNKGVEDLIVMMDNWPNNCGASFSNYLIKNQKEYLKGMVIGNSTPL